MDEAVINEELIHYSTIIIYDAYAIENGFAQNERKDRTELIRENNYDIETEAIKLQNRYLKLAGEI